MSTIAAKTRATGRLLLKRNAAREKTPTGENPTPPLESRIETDELAAVTGIGNIEELGGDQKSKKQRGEKPRERLGHPHYGNGDGKHNQWPIHDEELRERRAVVQRHELLIHVAGRSCKTGKKRQQQKSTRRHCLPPE